MPRIEWSNTCSWPVHSGLRLGRSHKANRARRLIHQLVHAAENEPALPLVARRMNSHFQLQTHMCQPCGRSQMFTQMTQHRARFQLTIHPVFTPPSWKFSNFFFFLYTFRKGRICVVHNLSDLWMWHDYWWKTWQIQQLTSQHPLSSLSPQVNHTEAAHKKHR